MRGNKNRYVLEVEEVVRRKVVVEAYDEEEAVESDTVADCVEELEYDVMERTSRVVEALNGS